MKITISYDDGYRMRNELSFFSENNGFFIFYINIKGIEKQVFAWYEDVNPLTIIIEYY